MTNMHSQLEELCQLSARVLSSVSECRQLSRAIEDVASSAVDHYKQEDSQCLHAVLQAVATIAQLLGVCTSVLLDDACAQHARIDQLAFQVRTCWPEADCTVGQTRLEQTKDA
jgi:hypothetical protein